ncbi:MAG TPA: CBS domain-containing protein [Polyangia bacterium]
MDVARHWSKLRLRARRILSRGNVVRVERWIPCPAQGATPIECCERCEHLDRILRDRDGREIGVSCRPLTSGHVPPSALFSRLARRALSVVPERTPIATVIASELLCVTPDVGLEAVAALFLDHGVSAVPVVDYERFPVGMVSKTDLARARLRLHDGTEATQVAELMSPVGDTVREEDTLACAASRMLARGTHHLVVIDRAGRAVGMVSSFDFVRFIASLSSPVEADPL